MEIRKYTLDELTEVLRSGFVQNNGAGVGLPVPAKRDLTATSYERVQFSVNNSQGVWPATEFLLGLSAGSSASPDLAPYYYGKWMLQIFASTGAAGNAGDMVEVQASVNNGTGANYTDTFNWNYHITGAIPIGTTIIDLKSQQDLLFQQFRVFFNLSSAGGNLDFNFSFDGIRIFW